MPWARLDDPFIYNQKAILAGKEGRMLFLTAICWSAGQLTDGLIRRGILPMLGALAETNELDATVARLVEVGLFEPAEAGYQIHDYLKYNPSSEQVKSQRAATAERQARWRAEKRGEDGRYLPESNAVSNAVSTDRVMPAPYPVPVPVKHVNSKTVDPLAFGSEPDAGAIAPGADAPRPVCKTSSKKPSTNGRAPPAHAEQFDALIDGLNYTRSTCLKSKAMRDCLNSAAKQLDELALRRDDVLFVCDDLRQKWKGTDFGPMAVAKWAATYERGP